MMDFLTDIVSPKIDLTDIVSIKGLLIYSLVAFGFGGIVGWFSKCNFTGIIIGVSIGVCVNIAFALAMVFFYLPDLGDHSIGYFAEAFANLVTPCFQFYQPPSLAGAAFALLLHYLLKKRKEVGSTRCSVI